MQTGSIARVVVRGRGGASHCMAVHRFTACLRSVIQQECLKERRGREKIMRYTNGALLQYSAIPDESICTQVLGIIN